MSLDEALRAWFGQHPSRKARGRGGAALYQYDPRGHLVAAIFGDGRTPGQVQHRASDPAGNLFRTADGSDRRYGRGGRLERAGGTEYRYDAEGNLTEKLLADGARWQYRWNHAGRLVCVVRPDGREARYGYDALGRRVRKEFDGTVTDFVWDGDDLVHERVVKDGEVAPIVTWLFEPGMFAPLAKLEGQKRFGVVTDHLGTPAVLMSEAGRVAWKAQLDVYGVPQETRGEVAEAERTENPWRYPGQYEDAETGLYYNRFRYYDPESGRYISEDPIRLEGGLGLHGYVQNPQRWADPLGLSACDKLSGALSSFRSKRFQFGSSTVLLDKKAMKHILERHHPKFWNGTTRTTQTFFKKSTSTDDISSLVGSILKQNDAALAGSGRRSGQLEGVVDGVTYAVSVDNGRVVQFFPRA